MKIENIKLTAQLLCTSFFKLQKYKTVINFLKILAKINLSVILINQERGIHMNKMEEIMNDIAIKPRTTRRLVNEGQLNLEEIIEFALSSQNPDYILNVALFTNDIRLATELIKMGKLDYMMILAEDENTSKRIKMLMLEGIAVSNNPIYIYCATKRLIIKDEDLLKLGFLEKMEDALIATENPRYIYKFALDIKGANLNKLIHALIELGDDMYMFLAHRDISGGPDEEIKFALEQMNTPFKARENDAKMIYKPAFKPLKQVS